MFKHGIYSYWRLVSGERGSIGMGLSRWALLAFDFDEISITVWLLNLEFYWRHKRLP